jgi:hypothetical protein
VAGTEERLLERVGRDLVAEHVAVEPAEAAVAHLGDAGDNVRHHGGDGQDAHRPAVSGLRHRGGGGPARPAGVERPGVGRRHEGEDDEMHGRQVVGVAHVAPRHPVGGQQEEEHGEQRPGQPPSPAGDHGETRRDGEPEPEGHEAAAHRVRQPRQHPDRSELLRREAGDLQQAGRGDDEVHDAVGADEHPEHGQARRRSRRQQPAIGARSDGGRRAGLGGGQRTTSQRAWTCRATGWRWPSNHAGAS